MMESLALIGIGVLTGILVGIPTAFLLAWWLEHKGLRFR